MARRYLGRQTEDSIDDKETMDSIEEDPFGENKRKFKLQDNESMSSGTDDLKEESAETQEELKETTEFMKVSNEDFKKRIERINHIKKLHENFDRELKILQEDEVISELDSDPNSSNPNSEVHKIGRDVSELISSNNKQRLKVMELQIESEKKQSAKLNSRIQEKMQSINNLETVLRTELSSEISNIIDDSTARKLKIMQMQLDSERKLSEELNAKIQENMATIIKYERELSEQRDKLEIEVQIKTKKLLQAERLSAIGELAARVAHDLRNPLSVIKGSVELIKVKNSSNASEFIVRQMNLIERAISRMSHQIEDVLDFVKPIPLKTSKNSIKKTIHYALEKTKLSSNVKLNLPENDMELTFDADKMDVVFDNLLTNAKQAIDDSGEITIKFSEDEKYAYIGITDSGPGIPEDILPKVFEPLVTTKQTGTGLGLASCLSIVKLHGGKITVKNNPTTFTIKLPK